MLAEDVTVGVHVLNDDGSVGRRCSDITATTRGELGEGKGDGLRRRGVGPGLSSGSVQLVPVEGVGASGEGVANRSGQGVLTEDVAVGVDVLDGDGFLSGFVNEGDGLRLLGISSSSGWFAG